MWEVKLVYGDRFIADKKEVRNNLVIFSGTNYTSSGMVFTNKKSIAKMTKIEKV